MIAPPVSPGKYNNGFHIASALLRSASQVKPDVRRHVPIRKRHNKAAANGKSWSQHVTETSDALDLEAGVFALKKSADQSRRRKSEPFRSAMSMLTFYINRAGQHLPKEQRDRLEEAKDELRALYGRPRKNPRHT